MSQVIDLLNSYGATLSHEDQHIFREIFSIDGKSSILKYQPFIWGEFGKAFYASVSGRYSLFPPPKFNNVFGQYKKHKILKTLKNFPLDIELDGKSNYRDNKEIYDPRFLLISLYHLLGPENEINCNQLIKSKGLSIALVGTSSNVDAIRNLSYIVLERFVFHLEARKPSSQNYFWVNFIDCFRASMKSPNQQMPFLLTSLLVQIIETIAQPNNPLFDTFKDFFKRKPQFDCNQISCLLINLLTSKDLQWGKNQRMILNLLANSVHSEQDFNFFKTNNLFNTILSIFSSKYADWLDRIMIIQIIKNCVQIKNTFKILVIENGLIVWLTNIVISLYRSIDSTQREEIINLIKLIKFSYKSTDFPKSIENQLMFIKSVVTSINQEPTPESS